MLTVEEKKVFLKMYRTCESELSAISEERYRLLGLQNFVGVSKNSKELTNRIWLSDDALVVNATKLIERREQICSAVSLLDSDVLRSVIRRRYLLGQSFEKIAEDMNYSWRHVLRLHKEAVEKLKL